MNELVVASGRMKSTLQTSVAVMSGSVVGLLVDSWSNLVLAGLLLAVGAGLWWLTREEAGQLVTEWQRVRARRTPALFRAYCATGPWLMWSALGALLVLWVRVGALD